MRFVAGLVAVVAWGCSQRNEPVHVPVGDYDGQAPVQDAGTLAPRACTPAVDAGAPLPPVTAAWEGYVDSSPLRSGNDSLKIVIRSDGTGPLSGSVMYGTEAAPPPPLDSNACYPGDLDWAQRPLAPLVTVEGFEYPILEAVVTATRLNVTSSTFAPWSEWCACQPPMPASDAGGWACLPNVSGQSAAGRCLIDYPAGQQTWVSCCKVALCQQLPVCSCSEAQCAVDLQPNLVLDLAVNGDHADGAGIHLVRTQ